MSAFLAAQNAFTIIMAHIVYIDNLKSMCKIDSAPDDMDDAEVLRCHEEYYAAIMAKIRIEREFICIDVLRALRNNQETENAMSSGREAFGILCRLYGAEVDSILRGHVESESTEDDIQRKLELIR